MVAQPGRPFCPPAEEGSWVGERPTSPGGAGGGSRLILLSVFHLLWKLFFTSYTKGVTSNHFCFNFFFLLTLKEWAVTVFALTCKGQGVPSAWWSSGAFSLADGEAMHSGPSRTTSRGFQLHKHPWVDSFSKVVLLAIGCSYSPDVKLSIVYLPWMLTCASEKDLAGEGTGLQDPFKE